MIYITLLYILFTMCVTSNGQQSNSDILLFENYAQRDIRFPKENLQSEVFAFNDSILVAKEILLEIEQKCMVDHELFNMLCDLETINKWNIYNQSEESLYPTEYSKYVEERKHDIKIVYLGMLGSQHAFDSYLFLVSYGEQDAYQSIKEVFMINTVKGFVTSVTRVCSHTCFDGECEYIYTQELEQGIFVQRDIVISSNMILLEESRSDNEETDIRFAYNRQGRLRILL